VVAGVSLELWLVRHGETDWSADRRFCGWSDVPLNPRGREQARALRQELATETFISVVSSDSTRAVETARLAYGEPRIDRRLRELDFGKLEGLTWDQCSLDHREALLRYRGFAAPGGESVSQLVDRVREALHDLRGGRHLLVTHGGVIKALLAETGHNQSYPQPASVHRLVLDNREVRLP
jgi:probable phosphoglycerate mutase